MIALASLRIAPAAVVAIANGTSLPGLPGYAYGPARGDTYGFYAAAREFISSWTRISKPLLALAVVVVAAVLAGSLRAWRRGRRGEAVAAASLACGLFCSLAVRQMGLTGAGAVGWPIVWSLPLFPLRAAGSLSYHPAYYIAFVLLLASNAATIGATAALARRLLPARYALIAPALLVVFPFLMRAVEGTGNIVYETWLADSGQLAYSEPLSTALVTVGVALVVLRPRNPVATAVAGGLAGLAVDVRVSNAPIAVVLFAAILIGRRFRPAATYAVAGAGTVSIALAFWSKGYASFTTHETAQAPNGLFSVHYLSRSWANSGVFDWKMLAILLPLPLLGAFALRGRPIALLALAGTIVVTAALYAAYYITALHPRFLLVALPSLFVLAAVGVASLTRGGRAEAPTAP